MSSCIVISASGAVEFTNEAITQCSGFVLVEPSEYLLQSTLHSIVSFPEVADLAGAWAVGFVIPITFALVGWCCGAVMSPLKK